MRKKIISWLLLITIVCINFNFADVVGATDEEISKILIKYNSLSKQVGDTFSLPYSVQPQTASKKEVLWFSSNPAVATVNSTGVVNCKSIGKTTIQAVSNNSIALASCQINVVAKDTAVTLPKKDQPSTEQPADIPVAVESATFNHTQLELVKGDSQYLIATIYPADATNKAADWKSTDPDIASIDQNGLITAKKIGKSTIYMFTKDGNKRAYCIVYVLPVVKEKKQKQQSDASNEDLPFQDVSPAHSQYEDIAYAYNNELMRGTSETLFDPDANVNRAMLATVIYRNSGEREVFINPKFSDVSPSAWYAKAVQWNSDVDLMNGVAEGVFAPENQLTREQLATILFRYAKYRKSDVNSFEDILYLADESEISEWAYQAMKWAHKNNLLSIEKGFIRPKATATRADVARALHAVMENVIGN